MTLLSIDFFVNSLVSSPSHLVVRGSFGFRVTRQFVKKSLFFEHTILIRVSAKGEQWIDKRFFKKTKMDFVVVLWRDRTRFSSSALKDFSYKCNREIQKFSNKFPIF